MGVGGELVAAVLVGKALFDEIMQGAEYGAAHRVERGHAFIVIGGRTRPVGGTVEPARGVASARAS